LIECNGLFRLFGPNPKACFCSIYTFQNLLVIRSTNCSTNLQVKLLLEKKADCASGAIDDFLLVFPFTLLPRNRRTFKHQCLNFEVAYFLVRFNQPLLIHQFLIVYWPQASSKVL